MTSSLDQLVWVTFPMLSLASYLLQLSLTSHTSLVILSLVFIRLLSTAILLNLLLSHARRQDETISLVSNISEDDINKRHG